MGLCRPAGNVTQSASMSHDLPHSQFLRSSRCNEPSITDVLGFASPRPELMVTTAGIVNTWVIKDLDDLYSILYKAVDPVFDCYYILQAITNHHYARITALLVPMHLIRLHNPSPEADELTTACDELEAASKPALRFLQAEILRYKGF